MAEPLVEVGAAPNRDGAGGVGFEAPALGVLAAVEDEGNEPNGLTLAEVSPFVIAAAAAEGTLKEGKADGFGASEIVGGAVKDGKAVVLEIASVVCAVCGVAMKGKRVGLDAGDDVLTPLGSSDFEFSAPKNDGTLVDFGAVSLASDDSTDVDGPEAAKGLSAGLDPKEVAGKDRVEFDVDGGATLREEVVADAVEDAVEDAGACLLFSWASFASWNRFNASASACCFCHRVEGALRPPLLLPKGAGEGEPNDVRARSGPRWDVRAKGLISPALSLGDTSAESGISQKLDDARAYRTRYNQ